MTTPALPQERQQTRSRPPVACMDSNRILVTGATGHVGMAVVDSLASWWNAGGSGSTQPKVHIRASSEDLSDLKKMKDKHTFLELAPMDFEKPEEYKAALKDVDTVFLLTPYTQAMMHYAKNFIDECVKASVKYLIHLGIHQPSPEIRATVVSWHRLIEAYIKQCGIENYLFLHPTNYMTEILEYDASGVRLLDQQKIISPFKPSAQVSWISPQDVGKVAAAILIKPHEIEATDSTIPLIAETASMDTVTELISKITGKAHNLQSVPVDEFAQLIKSRGRVDEKYLNAHLEYFQYFNEAKEIPEPNQALIERISRTAPTTLFDFLRCNLPVSQS